MKSFLKFLVGMCTLLICTPVKFLLKLWASLFSSRMKFVAVLAIALLATTTMQALTVDSTQVTTVTTYSLSFLFSAFGNYLSAHIWSVIFTVAFIISEIIASVKWVPKNSICQLLWAAFKAIINFFASKKTSSDTTEKTDTTAK